MRRALLATVLGLVACGGGGGGGPDASGGDPDAGELPHLARCEIEAPAPTALAVLGTRIVDGHGRTVHLRGVNAGGRSKFAPYAPFDFDAVAVDGYASALASYLATAQRWGIDVLRVPFSWQALEPVEGQIDDAYLARLDALIDGAWQRGMWTILDFHQDLYAEPFCGDGFPSWTLVEPGPPRHDCADWHTRYESAEVQAAFDAFWTDASGVRTKFRAMWQRMVERYRDHPGVIGYEPINEPHPGTASVPDWGAGVLTPFYQDMALLIATADPGALVFLDTTALDGVRGSTSLERPLGDQLVLAPHSYDPLALFGDEVSSEVEQRLSPWATLGASWDMPVLIGEMGIRAAHPDAAIHLRRHLDAMEALGLHGTWWEYSQSADIWNHEELSLVAADGTEAPMAGELARPYARALAGTRVGSSYQAERRIYALRYTPTGDVPSEIAISSRPLEELVIRGRGACYAITPRSLLVRADGGGDVELSIETRHSEI
jgi:endoglycosylceramidase